MISYYKDGISNYLIICVEFNCNNNCISCLFNGIRRKPEPVSFDQFKKIIQNSNKIKKYNSITLSGAEVTMNKDLLRFVKYTKTCANFFHIRIQTNGRRLSNYDYCKKLIDAGVDEFFVTIYAHSAEIHERITSISGSFIQTLQGLKNLNKFKVRIITNTVITKINYFSLPKIVNKITQFNKIKEMQFWNYWPMSEIDEKDLIAPNLEIKPFLMDAIRRAIRKNIKIIIKGFPACLLGKYRKFLDNSQPDTVIDKIFWEKYKKNQFGMCLYRDVCLAASKCSGLTHAYIKKFGLDKNSLYPISDYKI